MGRSKSDILVAAAALGFLALFLLLPLAVVFAEAFGRGWEVFLKSVADPDALAAVRLTLLVAALAVSFNLVFGLAAAWVLGKFRFRGRNLLVTLVDLPLSVSPVVSGLVFILVFGVRGWLGPLLEEAGFQVVFAVPGIVIATIFVTLPYVARELLPLMEKQGTEEEEAALTLGAGGWQIFRRITLPNVKWGLLYGLILCNARAMGEFGAVSVVSGRIRGETNTLPLQVEILYNEYEFQAAFAAASLLTLIALATMALKFAAGRKS